MTANLLSLNPSKAEFLLIDLISNPSLSLPSNHPITPTDSARNFGFIFASSLTFSKQISSLSSACNYHIRDIRLIRHTLDIKTVFTIATSLVHSKLGNSLYLNLPKKQISLLQLLQNSLDRAVTRTPKTEHITTVLKSLHWLKIEERIHYKIISLTYDSLHISQPQYLRKLINIKPAGSNRSSNHFTLLRPPTTSSLKISNRSYNRTAPILWNNLPKSMRTFSNTSPNSATTNQCSSLPFSLSKIQFRSHLKIFIFSISYPP